jgi:PAS domain-containing protein
LVDVEAIRRTFDQNRGYRELLQNTIELAGNALAVVDRDMSFRLANAAFQKLIGRGDLEGVPILATPFAPLAAVLQDAVRNGSQASQDLELTTAAGTFTAEVHARVFRLSEAPEVFLVGITANQPPQVRQ